MREETTGEAASMERSSGPSSGARVLDLERSPNAVPNSDLQVELQASRRAEEKLQAQVAELIAANQSAGAKLERYESLFQMAPDGYVVTGCEGVIQEANLRAASLLRTAREALPGHSLLDFVADADRMTVKQRLHEFKLGAVDRIDNWVVRIETRNRASFSARLDVAAHPYAGGVMVRWTIRDITKDRQAERKRAVAMARRAVVQMEARLELLAQAGSLLVGSLNVEENLADVARLAVLHLGGWCFVSMIDSDGKPRQLEITHAEPVSEDLVRRLRAHCVWPRVWPAQGSQAESEFLASSILVRSWNLEWRDALADGPEHAALLAQIEGQNAMLLPLRLRERLLGFMLLIAPMHGRYLAHDRDLFEGLGRCCALALGNAQLYRDALEERDKALEANRLKDELVAVLGHEQRNLLAPILKWAQILNNQPWPSGDATAQVGLRAIERNALILQRLVSDCIELSRNSVTPLDVQRTRLDFNQLVAESADAIRYLVADTGLSFTLELCGHPLPVIGDAVRLEQALVNLFTNAVKYTPADGFILVRTGMAGTQAMLDVWDSGIGIAPEALERIFEPFHRDPSLEAGGSSGLGLGLAVARQIIELHEGRVWAESPGRGNGSVFSVRLPLDLGTAEEPSRVLASSAPQERTVRILLVEDSADALTLMKTELEGMGYAVVAALSGPAGVEAARRQAPDLIVTDVHMPGMTGHDVVREIRALSGLTHLPAVALSGMEREMVHPGAHDTSPFDEWLVKPAEGKTLQAAINRALARKRPSQEAASGG